MNTNEAADKRIQYLLACLGEECGEVQQVVGKALRFGTYDHHPKTDDIANIELIRREVHDVLAVYTMLMRELSLPETINPLRIQNKIAKVERYL